MGSLLSESEKSELSLVFNDLHDTFARDIIIIKEAQRVIVTENPDYNFAYGGDQFLTNVEFTPVSGVFKGRIKWMDIEDRNNLQTNPNFKPSTFSNYCRIKLEPSGYNFIGTGVKEFWVDNVKCDWEGQRRPHGLFDIQFQTIFVRASE